MKKIPTLFQRDPETRFVTEEVTPGCEWVLAGEGVATRKYDGTCVMLAENGQWYSRREIKPGKPKPPNFIEVDRDDVTGKRVGWEPIAGSSHYKWFREVLLEHGLDFAPGTYELIGPKINGNPEKVRYHQLVPHGIVKFETDGRPQTFETIRDLILTHHTAFGMEGIVWHHPDGRRAKLKARDFAS
jgi:hypothetical protein